LDQAKRISARCPTTVEQELRQAIVGRKIQLCGEGKAPAIRLVLANKQGSAPGQSSALGHFKFFSKDMLTGDPSPII
jgi:hypothetical protein